MTTRLILLSLLALPAFGAVAHAQAAPADPAPPGNERVKQVIVYGDDPCPASQGDEITVCARMAERERYRIPAELRTDPNDPHVQAWMNRAESIEYVSRTSGTDSCSPVGGGGFTGCFQRLSRQAREERRTLLGDSTWANAVSAERERRLSGIDAESEQVEQRVKAEEAAAAARQPQTAPPADLTTGTNVPPAGQIAQPMTNTAP